MLDPTPPTSDATMTSSESQELNITELFYLHLGKNVVDVGNFDNDLNKILESYNSSAPSSSGTLPTDKKSASLKAALEKIKENNKPKTSEEINDAIEETPEQIKEAIKETLRLYKEYFSIKLSSDGNPNNHDDATKNILNNFTKDDEGSLVKSIYNSVNDDHNLELQASLKRYLGGLLVKAESKNSDTIEDQKDNIEEIKNILAIFPGGYKIVDQKVVTDIDFICIAGSKERVDNAFFALNDSSPEVRAIKSVIDKFAAQLAPKVRQGLQIHTAPCIELSLAIARNDIKDPSAVSPQQYITSREMLAFSYNLNKMIEKEFEISKERLAEDYERLFKKIEEISQEGWEDPDQKENKLLTPQEKKQGTILKKINIFIEQVNNSGFNIESVAGILKDDCDSANITTASLIPLEELKEKYPIKVPTEKFQKELSAVTADRLPKYDYLKHLLDPEKLFKDSLESEDEPSNRLDVKKIKNLLDLFPTKEAMAEARTLDEEAQNTQKSKMLSGLVTLRNILDDYKTNDDNYFYFLKFDKKFKEKTGESFEDFFYENINGPLVDGSPEVKEEFKHAKPILGTIASKINAKRISFEGENVDVSLLIHSLVSDEEKENGIKKLFTAIPKILDIKNASGENIAKILYQFSEEVLLTALEAKPELFNKITERNNQSASLLQIITQRNEKELLSNILKKYQEAHQKEGDEDGKKALGEMIYKQELLFQIVNENKADLLEEIIPMLNIEDLNKADKKGKTPLHIAAENGHTEIVKALLTGEGIDINARGDSNLTPLHYAARNGHIEVVEVLLKNGAPVDLVSDEYDTPLHYAAQNGHTKVVEVLLKNGANIEAEGTYYNQSLGIDFTLTPLHYAAEWCQAKVVELLLKNGACVSKMAVGDKDYSAMEWVLSEDNNNLDIKDEERDKVINILFKYGANISPELLEETINSENISDTTKELVTELSQPERILARDEALREDPDLIEDYKNFILNGKLTLDSANTLVLYNESFGDVIVKAINSITKEESAEIKKNNLERFEEIQKFISQAKDPKSGEKRSLTDFSAHRGNEVGSPEHPAGESLDKKPKTEEAGAEIGGVDRVPSPSISGQKRGREEGREGEDSLATQLAAGDPTKRSKTDGGAGGGAAGGAGRGAGGVGGEAGGRI